jgi:hypothetical protein
VTRGFRCPSESLSLGDAAGRLADLGFLAGPDLPDRPGPGYLLVALRPQPTLRHFDPESVEFWVTVNGRGVRRSLTRASPVPIDTAFSWGLIRVVDRLHVTNEFLTFGGHLSAAGLDDAVVAVFRSSVPMLCRGGHSQLWDDGADQLAAFFARLTASLWVPGLETEFAAVDEHARYSAFLADIGDRYRSSPALQASNAAIWATLRNEEAQMRAADPAAWQEGERLLEAMHRATDGVPCG